MLKAQFSVHWAESNLADRVEKDSFITLPGKGEIRWAPASKNCVPPLGEDSEKFYSNESKRAKSARGHSYGLVVM